ncbi:high-affinity choline transporter 1 [Nematostella vectensis]|uniref:high-affinity choline transporter 1 n=1 Tax=Nematostella vectensis TaxID=45351 RepID=UPI0020773A73|nr:high-affinity choline transporter 1 [Nematostella vectensis]
MVYIVGVVGIVVFYIVILVLGLWAARRRKEGEEETMLAGRSIGLFVGTFTMTATWVGGGYINGTAEMVYTSTLVWAQAPWGYALSLVIGGLVFAKIMRKREYFTMLDPFQEKYGVRMGGLLYIPALMGEIFWTGAILSALGATVSVVIGLGQELSVIVSACIAIFYTLIGGLYSVAYTDVIQLVCIFIGLWLSIPFALTHDAVTDISVTATADASGWIGEFPVQPGPWIDFALLLTFGGIPWQVYFQRVLSCKTVNASRNLSLAAAVGCIIMAIPAVIIGAIGKSTDWTKTGFYTAPAVGVNQTINATFVNASANATTASPIVGPSGPLVLPMVLRHLTPNYIAFFGLGAVSAAVMSSADSSVLSAASMFSHNIYKMIFRQKATQRELLWVMRLAIFLVGAIATIMALVVESVYTLWFLCGDVVYVTLFPQLCCVIFFHDTNTYGSFTGFILGILLRVLGGEPALKIPVIIKFPYYNETDGQLFPFRTLSMVCAFVTILAVSYLARLLFLKGVLPLSADFAECFTEPKSYELKETGNKSHEMSSYQDHADEKKAF